MAEYYNKTKSGRAATLRDGTSQFFPAKRWVEIPEHLEGSPDVVRLKAKGVLVRREPPKSAPAPLSKPAPRLAPVLREEPKVEPPKTEKPKAKKGKGTKKSVKS